MPYKNIFLFEGQKLGSTFSSEDDPYRALREGYTKREQIARILRLQIPAITDGEIEIQCWWYDPQYHFFPELFPKEQLQLTEGGKRRPTLASLKVG